MRQIKNIQDHVYCRKTTALQFNLSYQSTSHWTACSDSSNPSTYQQICHRPVLELPGAVLYSSIISLQCLEISTPS